MEVTVDCRRADGGWHCDVILGDDAAATSHAVTVSDETLQVLAPGAGDPRGLVDASFQFLLEREPRESILRTFELPVIGSYFPEWEREMQARLAER